MGNIFGAMNYQAARDNFTVYGFLAAVIIYLMAILEGADILSSGGMFFACCGFVYPFLIPVTTLIWSSRICGWDFADKTINLELLCGHSRAEVYFGRILASALWCVSGVVLLVGLPLVVASLAGGWGVNVDLGGAMLRLALMLPPTLRLIAEYIFIAFALRNCYAAMLAGFLATEASSLAAMIADELWDKDISLLFASSTITKLSELADYSLGYADGEDILLIDTSVDPTYAVLSIAVSAVVIAALIPLGYAVFGKRDLS